MPPKKSKIDKETLEDLESAIVRALKYDIWNVSCETCRESDDNFASPHVCSMCCLDHFRNLWTPSYDFAEQLAREIILATKEEFAEILGTVE